MAPAFLVLPLGCRLVVGAAQEQRGYATDAS